jgi:hypothetical protein
MYLAPSSCCFSICGLSLALGGGLTSASESAAVLMVASLTLCEVTEDEGFESADTIVAIVFNRANGTLKHKAGRHCELQQDAVVRWFNGVEHLNAKITKKNLGTSKPR